MTSIAEARAERDAATGYTTLLAEVKAIEAAVSGSTTPAVKSEVTALGNKVRRPPLREDFSNDVNSLPVRKAQVDAVRAVAQALAPKV